MQDFRLETVTRELETRIGRANAVRDIYLGDELWGHILEMSEPTRFLLIRTGTDVFAVNFSLKTHGDITHVIDHARKLTADLESQTLESKPKSAERIEYHNPNSLQELVLRFGRIGTFLFGTIAFVTGVSRALAANESSLDFAKLFGQGIWVFGVTLAGAFAGLIIGFLAAIILPKAKVKCERCGSPKAIGCHKSLVTGKSIQNRCPACGHKWDRWMAMIK